MLFLFLILFKFSFEKNCCSFQIDSSSKIDLSGEKGKYYTSTLTIEEIDHIVTSTFCQELDYYQKCHSSIEKISPTKDEFYQSSQQNCNYVGSVTECVFEWDSEKENFLIKYNGNKDSKGVIRNANITFYCTRFETQFYFNKINQVQSNEYMYELEMYSKYACPVSIHADFGKINTIVAVLICIPFVIALGIFILGMIFFLCEKVCIRFCESLKRDNAVLNNVDTSNRLNDPLLK